MNIYSLVLIISLYLLINIFIVLDFFFLFIFFEGIIIPMFFLIAFEVVDLEEYMQLIYF